MGLAIFIFLVASVLGLIYYYFKKKFAYWKNRGFDYIEPDFPFGSLKGVGYKVHFSQKSKDFYLNFRNKSKAIGIYFFTAPIAFITNLDTVKHVLVKDFNNFHDRGLYVNTKADPLSGHLFSLEGSEWKNMRAKLTPTFTSGKMKMMFDTVKSICEEMIEFMKTKENNAEIEMKDILARYTTDVIGNVAFGLDINSMKNPDSTFRKMGRKVFDTPPLQTIKVLMLMSFRNFFQKFNLMINNKEVSDFFLGSIQETVEYRESNNIKRNDFLSLLLEIKNHGKIKDDDGESIGKLTLGQLSAQSFLFFLAGFETSSTTMTFCLYELSLNPDIQEKLREDIKNVLAKHDNQLTYEAMLDMKYLQMVIDETLRKFPPVDNLVRYTANDYKIPDSDLVIEKATQIFISVIGIHHNPDIYPNPDKFDPERFTEENKKSRHPMAHLPFGEGPRNCIGLRFGLMQTKIGLIRLLTNFKFSPGPKTTIPMIVSPSSPLLAPKYDMWLKVEKL